MENDLTFATRFRIPVVLCAVCLACRVPGPAAPSDDFVRATNRGKAHLENRDSRGAIEAFAAALEIGGERGAALRNLARAQLLARDEPAALDALARAAELGSESAATSYLTGLALARRGQFEEALPHLEDAARLDPRTAALRYQLANAYQALGRHQEAADELRATVELDPLHTGALYKLAGYARRFGQEEELEAYQRDLTRLRRLLGDDERQPEMLERCVYTEAETVTAPPAPAPPAEVRFAELSADLLDPADGARAAAALGLDDRGRVRLLLAGEAGWTLAASGAEGGGFERRELSLEPLSGEAYAVVGNYYDEVPEGTRYDPAVHAETDVAVIGAGGVRLFAGTRDGFEEVTAAAGLAGAEGRRGRWVDYEHDGDLDFLVAGEGLELWQNNGDGRFEEVSAEVGVASDAPVWDVAAVDLDGNLAVDVVAARGEAPTLVFDNLRTGMFRPRPGVWPAARRVLVGDVDGDARPDAVLVGAESVVIVPGGPGERVELDLGAVDPAAAALLDFDNDGRLDLLVAGAEGDRGRFRLWRNESAGWSDVTEATGLADVDAAAVRDLDTADLDGDGDTDLVVRTARGLSLFDNVGGDVQAQLKLELVGTKTNPSGLGTRVELRRGSFRLTRTVTDLPVEIGLGGGGPLDSLQVLWTNGIVDNQIDVEVTGEPLSVVEKNVATGSCPFLYAWDGRRFRFVTDILGNSPVGLSLVRGVPLDADPDELVRIGGEAAVFGEDFVPRGGAFTVQVTEEMREVLYLDHARLIAVDHPPEVEVHATDKLMPAPFPASELVPLGSLRPPREARGDDGLDRTAALAAADGDFAPPGVPLPPPFRGMTRPLALTLDFGALDAARSPVLALTGWLQYGDASTNIALSQGPPDRVVPPRLEAETAGGRWRAVDVVVGMPAGKTKTILVDLEGRLPPGTRRLRLTTSFEIRWDRIALGERLPVASVARHSTPPSSAVLAWRGFSEIRSRAPGHPTTPDFDAVSEHPPWETALRGWATRYGDVGELVRERDERLAVINAGDALELAFDAVALPPVPAGRVRTYYFYSVGWDKDGDVNVIDGDTVEPLPVAAAGDWQERYNTRWVPWERFRRHP